MSRRTSLAILLAVVLAVLAGLVVWKSGTAASGTPEPVSPPAPAARGESVAVAAQVEARESRAVAAELAPSAAPVAEPTPPPSAAPAEVPDLDAKRPLELVVVDEMHQPVFDAAIRIDGMRSASDPGSWFDFREGPAVARTDPRGRAKLDCWTWVNVDGRTISVDLSVTHPEYVPFRDDAFALGPGEHEIVLKRGAVVSVRAWHGTPSRIVTDIEIDLELEAALGPQAWTRESDGRMVTTRIAPGQHLVRVTHRPKAAGAKPLYSDIEAFEVRPSERVDLAIELHAALELAGQLDDSVPRPVTAGKVMLTLQQTRRDGSGGCLWDMYGADVRADGTFAFQDLPRGKGYVFALCSGHVAKPVRAGTLAEAGIHLAPGSTKEDEERAWRDFGDRAMLLQRAEVPAATTPFVIEMQPTGSVEIAVALADGTPVADADVGVSPNVQIPGVGSIVLPWREWNGKADSLGVARFDDLPPDPSLWVNAGARGLQMREADRKDLPSVAVKPGEVARITIALEREGTAADSAPK